MCAPSSEQVTCWSNFIIRIFIHIQLEPPSPPRARNLSTQFATSIKNIAQDNILRARSSSRYQIWFVN